MAGRLKKPQAQRKQLDLDVNAAWNQFLNDFNQKQFDFQRAVQSLAVTRRHGGEGGCWGGEQQRDLAIGGVSHGAAAGTTASGSGQRRAPGNPEPHEGGREVEEYEWE